MPEKSSNGRAESAFPPMMMMPFGFEAFMEFHRPALAAAAQMNGKVYDGIAAMNKNWVAFINRRLKEDLALPQQLAGCRTLQDMYGVYNDFFQRAYADYQAEFEQLSKLGKALAEDTVQAVQSGAEEVAKSATEKARTRAA
jgi:Phasin protein